MYNKLESLYNLFYSYNFNLASNIYPKKNYFRLDFINIYNKADKFSIIFQNNSIFTIIPLKSKNYSFISNTYNLDFTLNFINKHLYNYYL